MSIARPALHPLALSLTPTTTADHHLFTSSLSISLGFAFYFILSRSVAQKTVPFIRCFVSVRSYINSTPVQKHQQKQQQRKQQQSQQECASISALQCTKYSTSSGATNHLVLINISSCSSCSSNFKLCLFVCLSLPVAASVSVLRHHLSSN